MPVPEDPAAQVREGLENKAIVPSAVHFFFPFLQKKTQTRLLTN